MSEIPNIIPYNSLFYFQIETMYPQPKRSKFSKGLMFKILWENGLFRQ